MVAARLPGQRLDGFEVIDHSQIDIDNNDEHGWALTGAWRYPGALADANFNFPAGALKPDGDNIVSVLTVNMGHEEDYNSTNGNKAARGLTSASLIGAPLTSITWRLQGVRGGEDMIDPVRGPLSTGGLYGERAGWSLPGYPDSAWTGSR